MSVYKNLALFDDINFRDFNESNKIYISQNISSFKKLIYIIKIDFFLSLFHFIFCVFII